MHKNVLSISLCKVGGIDVLLIGDSGFDGWKCLSVP